MTPTPQATYASGAVVSTSASLAASVGAALIYWGVCVVAALYLADGGFEVLAATFVGAANGARTITGSRSRFEHVASYSYAGMWIGIMLAGLLHAPLAALVELAGVALR